MTTPDKELLELEAKVDIEKNGKTIATIQDIANLSPDEFARFLPDLKAWHEAAYNVQGLFENEPVKTSLIWFDDGIEGTLRYVDFLKKDGSTLFRLKDEVND